MDLIKKISCPGCGHQFNAEQALANDIEEKLKIQYNQKFKGLQSTLIKQSEEKEEALLQKLALDKKNTEELIRKKAKEEIAFELKSAQEDAEKNRREIRELKTKELEFIKKEQALKDKEYELELVIQKKLIEGRKEIEENIKRKVLDENQMTLKERDLQIQSMKEQIDVMKRKADQGSMQLQGEVQEIILEELLKGCFKFDLIDEVAKGVRGADVIHTVRNTSGKECGRIIYESKRTKLFKDEWIDKLKGDVRSQKADIAVIVTQTMPSGMEKLGVKDGIWICSFSEIKGVSMLLRDSLIKIFDIRCSQENKGDKMQMLYDYLTRNEFIHQFQAIVEGFSCMKEALESEKRVTMKIWKEREKQLDKVLQNSADIYGSIRGIAGNAVGEIKQLEYPDYLLEQGEDISKTKP